MHDSISSTGSRRSRVRRGLGVLAGAALLVTPLALAPAAQAVNRNPLGGTDLLLQGVIQGLPNTLSHPVGDGAGPGGCQGIDGIGTLATCLVDPLGPNRATKAKVKASIRNGKVKSVRRVSR
jgi:hypothetical protein